MGKQENLIVGLDIGTTKISCIVGELTAEGIDIIGIGSHPSRGLRKGVVVNIESTVSSIKKAVEEAELMAGCGISSVYAGIAGGHIKGLNSHGVIAVKDSEVREADVRRVIDAARAVAIPMDREVLHILPQEYIIDDQDGIRQPIGMSGVRLEAQVHIVTGAATSAQNIVKCANQAGLDVNDIVLEQLASAEAVLSSDEKDLGVAIVDIGGGTSDIAIFVEGSIRHTAVLSIGGDHLTNDIAIGLRTPTAEAEKIKKKYGCAMSSMVGKDDTISVPSMGGRDPRTLSRQLLADIIEPRVEEIFTLVRNEIIRSGYEDILASGIVITGGSSLMEGMPELGEQIFNLPVRMGAPIGIGGLVDVVNSPIHATGVGLILHGNKDPGKNRFKMGDENLFNKITKRMKDWFSEYF